MTTRMMIWIIDFGPKGEAMYTQSRDCVYSLKPMSLLGSDFFLRWRSQDAMLSYLIAKLDHETNLNANLWDRLSVFLLVTFACMGSLWTTLPDLATCVDTAACIEQLRLGLAALGLGLSVTILFAIIVSFAPSHHVVLPTAELIEEWWRRQVAGVPRTKMAVDKIPTDELAYLCRHVSEAVRTVHAENRSRYRRMKSVQSGVVALSVITVLVFALCAIQKFQVRGQSNAIRSEHVAAQQ